MAGELERLTTEVAETGTVVDSAVTLLEGLSEFIRNNAGDPAALGKFADDLDAHGTRLAAAVAANPVPTGGPAPDPEPDPDPVDPVDPDPIV